jgi:hypothetical protein
MTITSNFTLQIAASAHLAPGVTSASVDTMTRVPGPKSTPSRWAAPFAPSEVSNALVTLCRNATTDPG